MVCSVHLTNTTLYHKLFTIVYNAPVLKKAIDIIRFIVKSNGNPVGVSEISKGLSISKSTVFGILKALEEEGFILKEESTKRYIIGNALLELSKNIFKSGELTAIARPFLEKLVSFVNETVFLCIKEGNIVRVLDVIEGKKAFKISTPIGAKFPITASVMCKAFLSPMDNETIRGFLKEHGLPGYTENSITDQEHFIKEIEKTRITGCSIDLEEYLKGIRAVATLVWLKDVPAAAICVVGFSRSMKDENLPNIAKYLKETAIQISARLSRFEGIL